MNKTTFVLYSEQWGPLSCLSDEQLGRLFRHIFCWLIDGSGDVKKEEQLVETDILIPYRFMTTQISIDTEKFKRKCEKNRQNIMKRWAKKKKDTNVDLVIHNENENVNENVNGNESENGSVSANGRSARKTRRACRRPHQRTSAVRAAPAETHPHGCPHSQN